jgi:hypothetical protein
MAEYRSRTGKRFFSSPGEFRRWNDLPYGKWTCADGREVLFNRFYEPIYQRLPHGPVELADANEWVPYKSQEWFYDDGYSERRARAAAKAILINWGVSL